MTALTRHKRAALRKIRRRVFCAEWLLDGRTLRSLLRRGLVRRCGFYSVEISDQMPGRTESCSSSS
jgi:hypothetical protein